MSSKIDVISELHDFVYDKVITLSPSILEHFQTLTWSQQLHIIETYYIENSEDPVMKLCLPTPFDIFIKSNHKQVCEFIVYNLPLLNTSVIQEFIDQNDGKRLVQWKVDFAKDWLEMYKDDSEDENNDKDDVQEQSEDEEDYNDGETEEDSEDDN